MLLLEAGPDHRAADAPLGLRSANFFHAVSEPGRIWPNLVAARSTGQNETLYVRGRGVGGSSSVNALGAIRGTVDDYERWGGELGCPGWGWPEMLAAAGPNDMQMIWFGAIGRTEEALAGGRLIGAVMRVFSHGEVRLRSQDPGMDPVVEFSLLSDERDLVRLRDCVRRMIRVVRHGAVSSISDGVLALATPIDDLDSDDVIDAWLAENVNDYVHAVGTCRMGAPGDRAAVVNTDCRVMGPHGPSPPPRPCPVLDIR